MNPTSEQLARIVWTQCWQVSLLIVVVGGTALTVCRRRPHAAHLLWILVLVKCITPPIWSSRLGVFSWAQAESVAATTAVNPFDEVDQFLGSIFSERAAAPEAQREVQFATAEPPVNWSIANVLAGVWAAGAAGLAILTGLNWWTCYRAFRQSHVTPEPALTSVLQRIAGRLGLRRPVRLVVTSRRLGPAVFGLLKPTLVLPQAVLKGKSTRELEPIVAHELVHLRRGDVLVNGLQAIVQLLWWFHPLVWWANRHASRVCERCCDEEVVAGLGYEPYDYARCLLDVLERKHALRPVFAFPGLRAAEITSRRLENIMKHAKQFHACTPRVYWLLLLASAVFVLPGAGLTLSASPQPSDETEASEEVADPTNDNSPAAATERDAEAALKALGAKVVRNDDDEVVEVSGISRQLGEQELAQLRKLNWSPTRSSGNPDDGDDYVRPALMDVQISDADLVHLKGFTRLRRLRIEDGGGFTGAGLVHLKGLTSLETLVLDGTKITDAGLVPVKALTSLKLLGLVDTEITDAGLVHLKGLTNLEWLELDGTEVTDAGLVHLKGLTSLKQLWLTRTVITDAGLVHLKGLSSLKRLGLSDTEISDAGLVHLKTLTSLERLWFERTEISDAGLVHLKGLSSLDGLIIQGTEITGTGLVHLHGLTNFGVLLLGGTEISDAGLAHLKGLTSLKLLILNDTGISDAGLVHLKGLTNLGYLWLNDTEISDAGLAHLKEMTSLGALFLRGTEVSDAGISKLKEALPKCRITFP